MSDFEKWWKDQVDRYKEEMEQSITEAYFDSFQLKNTTKAAWNHQQKRIENLKEAVEIISDYEPKDEHDGWIKDVCGIALKRDKELTDGV